MTTQIQLTTPALLFSTISLLVLAYTNRFLAITNLVRTMYGEYVKQPDKLLYRQIFMLRKRAHLIKQIQILCILALFFSALSMLLIVYDYQTAAAWVFASALFLLTLSLGLAVYEVAISTQALNLTLADLDTIMDEGIAQKQEAVRRKVAGMPIVRKLEGQVKSDGKMEHVHSNTQEDTITAREYMVSGC